MPDSKWYDMSTQHERTQAILRGAAHHIEEHGFTQNGFYYDADGCTCVVGAIRSVVMGRPLKEYDNFLPSQDQADELNLALSMLRAWLRTRVGTDNILSWSDEAAGAQVVIDGLKEAASL